MGESMKTVHVRPTTRPKRTNLGSGRVQRTERQTEKEGGSHGWSGGRASAIIWTLSGE